MANYTVGDMVFESRMARGYSQEELCFGICSTSSLSRIENNEQIPGRKIFEALMQRLGIPDSLYSVYISREEMEICKLIQNLVWSQERMDFEESEEIVKELEGKLGRNRKLEKQYVSFAKANIYLHKTGDHERFFEMLLDAIRITMKDFEPKKGFNRRLLTFHEITILACIATELYNHGERGHGLKLLYALKEYMDTHLIDEVEKAKKYPLVIYNLTTCLNSMGQYQKAYELCGQTIDFCILHNKLISLPFLLVNMASAAAELNRHERAKELFGRALALFKICKKESLAENVKREAFSRYGIEIEKRDSVLKKNRNTY